MNYVQELILSVISLIDIWNLFRIVEVSPHYSIFYKNCIRLQDKGKCEADVSNLIILHCHCIVLD